MLAVKSKGDNAFDALLDKYSVLARQRDEVIDLVGKWEIASPSFEGFALRVREIYDARK